VNDHATPRSWISFWNDLLRNDRASLLRRDGIAVAAGQTAFNSHQSKRYDYDRVKKVAESATLATIPSVFLQGVNWQAEL